MKDKFIPRNQADCDHANALREHEVAHKHWMNTSVFSPSAATAKTAKDEARADTSQRTTPRNQLT